MFRHKKKRKIRLFEYLVFHDFFTGGKVSDAFIRICLIRKNAPDLPGWVTDIFWFLRFIDEFWLPAPQKCSRSARLSQPHWSVLIYTAMQSHNQLYQFDSTTIPWWVLINWYVSVDQVCGKHASRIDGCLKVLWQNLSRKIRILFHKIFSKKLSPN